MDGRLRSPNFRVSMQTPLCRPLRAALALVTAATLACIALSAQAARIGVLSNKNADQVASDFQTKIPNHSFTGVDVGAGAPPLSQLTTQFDALLLFEDGSFAQAPGVGNTVAAFARGGRAVVLGTFYDQDRSDGSPEFTPHGWGELEGIDPNTTDGVGTPYQPRTLGTVVPHPLTVGVTSLSSAKLAGGNQPKSGTIVVASWTQKNAKGGADPAAAYRITGSACVIHIAIAPDYPIVGTSGSDFGGDFYRLWRNAFDFASNHCITGTANLPDTDVFSIPTTSGPVLVLLAALLALLGAQRVARRTSRTPTRR
jgi:hypothetical protein